MKKLITPIVLIVMVAGCGGSGGKNPLLTARHARGPLSDVSQIEPKLTEWFLFPDAQTQEEQGVSVTMAYMTPKDLNEFFENPNLFGDYAGKNPFSPEHFVFYVKVENARNEKVLIIPDEAVIVDDRGNQYHTIGTEYVLEFGKSKTPYKNFARSVVSSASPGFYGFSIPVGKIIASTSDEPSTLITQSVVQSGYLYPEVVYDGLIAFRQPTQLANALKFYMMPIKTGLNPEGVPQEEIQFIFELAVYGQEEQSPEFLEKQAVQSAENAELEIERTLPEELVEIEPSPTPAEVE